MSIADGIKIKVKFTQPLIGVTAGAELTGDEAKFKVSFDTYDYQPGGSIVRVTREVKSIEVVDEYTILLILNNGSQNSIQNAIGDVIVSYDGSGNLVGLGGPALAFEKSFTPKNLVQKIDPMNAEHIELVNIAPTGILKEIYYTGVKSSDEHIELVNIVPTGVLTKIDDI